MSDELPACVVCGGELMHNPNGSTDYKQMYVCRYAHEELLHGNSSSKFIVHLIRSEHTINKHKAGLCDNIE